MEQVKLQLTNNGNILAALRKKKMLVKRPGDEAESLAIQFSAVPFYFRRGVPISVSKNVGEAIRRSSGVIMGDDLTGDVFPAVEVVGEFILGDPTTEQRASATTCNVCGKDYVTMPKLIAHLKHGHTSDRADLYVEVERAPATNYDAPQIEQSDEDDA